MNETPLSQLPGLVENHPIPVGIGTSLAAAGLIAIGQLTRRLCSQYSMRRKFWGRSARDFTLVSGQIYFQDQPHRYMAAGDIKAILALTLSVQKVFKLNVIPHRFANTIVPKEDLHDNLFSVGGPKYNRVTQEIMELYAATHPEFPVSFVGNKIVVKAAVGDGESITEYTTTKKDDKVLQDFGLLIRGPNPFDDTKTSTAWVIAGAGSNGCEAAADQLSQFIRGSEKRFRRYKRFLVGNDLGLLIVRATTLDGEYASSFPVFMAAYKTKKRFWLFGRKCQSWIRDNNP